MPNRASGSSGICFPVTTSAGWDSLPKHRRKIVERNRVKRLYVS